MKKYYKKHPEKKVAWKKWNKEHRRGKSYRVKDQSKLTVRREIITEFYRQAKTVPCADCGTKYDPWVMQFDHRVGTEKCYNVSYMAAKGMSIDKLKEEMIKCDVVCANCHCKRTHDRIYN